MESEASVIGDPNPWSSDTNWTVVRGTLVNSITFESSSTPDEALKSPPKRHALIMKPGTPDSNPCEITINFARKHELRQIYVKSSARVYEIYTQSNLQSESEYLCTVRCSSASSDDDLDDDDDDEVSNGPRDNEMPLKENNVGSEEEWVSVKGPEDSSSLSVKPEFYEATAQISDVEPCLSVTLRLLSVQRKDSIVIDEIFVFADPIDDTTELENHKNANTNGNSLMAMILPSLLQMSKTKTSSKAQEESNFELPRKPNIEKVDSSEASFSSSSKVEVSKIEASMDRLVSRIDGIEGLFMRLEENLLKPIHSIEARLKRVENQLEALNGKMKNADNDDDDQPSCSRFSAPNISSEECESNAKRFHLESDDDNEEEIRGSDMVVESSSVDREPKRALTVEGALASALARLMMNHTPAFTMKVPEFLSDSFSTDANENDSPRSQRDEVGTGSVTMDSGHYSSASPPTLPRVHLGANLEQTSEEVNGKNQEEEDEEKQDSCAENREEALSSANPDPFVEDGNVIVLPKTSESSLGAPSKVDFEIPVLDVKFRSLDTQEALSNADSDPFVEDGKETVLLEKSGSSHHAPSKVDFEPPVLDVKFRSLDIREALSSVNPDPFVKDGKETVLLEKSESSPHAPSKVDIGTPVLDVKFRSLDTQEALSSVDPDPFVEDGHGVVLPKILESSFDAPTKVDFEMPVLDVKFRSLDTQDSNFSLEALLSEFPESREEIVDTEARNKDMEARNEDEDRDLISVEDDERVGPLISTQIFMDFNYCSLQDPLTREDETPLASVIPCSHESLPTTLI